MKIPTFCPGIAPLLGAVVALGAQRVTAVEPPVRVDPSPLRSLRVEPPPRVTNKLPAVPAIEEPLYESSTTVTVTNEGFGTRAAFTPGAVPAADSSSLTAPVTINYSGNSPVLVVQDSGTNKGIESLITNSKNSTSALYGQTNGSGAGLTGYNNGTVGPAGKFGITNDKSYQPGIFATTNGLGPAILGTITTPNNYQTALLGQNTVTKGAGTGVQGIGGSYGVAGISADGIGVFGEGATQGVSGDSSSGSGLHGQSDDGAGLTAISNSGYGADVFSSAGTALHAASYSGYAADLTSSTGTALHAMSKSSYAILAESTQARAIEATSQTQVAIYGESHGNAGVWGQGNDTFGIVGEDSGSGIGVWGSSESGYAGYFLGTVAATSYQTVSDRNVKTEIGAVNGAEVLAKIIDLPVTAWVFKSDRQKKHVGPMAQDFHAAFGLDGDDDRHINLTDISGVSLAAIQELGKEMQRKDAQIAALQSQLKSMSQLAARVAALEKYNDASAAPRKVFLKTKSRSNDGNGC